MELKLNDFKEGLQALTDFINANKLQPEHIQLIVREGNGYKMLFWVPKIKIKE